MISTDVTITPDNLVAYYKAFVVDAYCNDRISWASNSYPHGYFDGSYLDGSTAGRSISITGANVGTQGNLIDASDIYDALVGETAKYTVIRNMRVILYLSGSGTIFDSTAKSYMSSGYLQSYSSPDNAGVVTDNTITASQLEALFSNLRENWASLANNVVTVSQTICHSSCHSNCHSSRGRR
jgi:hypothetical protein